MGIQSRPAAIDDLVQRERDLLKVRVLLGFTGAHLRDRMREYLQPCTLPHTRQCHHEGSALKVASTVRLQLDLRDVGPVRAHDVEHCACATQSLVPILSRIVYSDPNVEHLILRTRPARGSSAKNGDAALAEALLLLLLVSLGEPLLLVVNDEVDQLLVVAHMPQERRFDHA